MFENYEHDFDLIIPDYPGFGESDSPQNPWDIKDYANWTKAFLQALHIENPIMMGHSNGGRIIIQLSSIYPFQKAILHSSAGLHASYYRSDGIKLCIYQLISLASILLNQSKQKKIRSFWAQRLKISDYLSVSHVLYKTMRILDKHGLEKELRQMTCDTLLIFGDQDHDTPLYQGRQMEALLPNGALVVFEGAGHFAFIEQEKKFISVINAFIYDEGKSPSLV
jgi:pimeloyl-ACP methyl ester carboxylesterase